MASWGNPPYYISAYSLDVKYGGYTGTLEQWLVDQHYRVGAIYLSTDSTSPATLFGGTWVEIEDKVLVTAGENYTAGETVSVDIGSGTGTGLVVYAWKRTK